MLYRLKFRCEASRCLSVRGIREITVLLLPGKRSLSVRRAAHQAYSTRSGATRRGQTASPFHPPLFRRSPPCGQRRRSVRQTFSARPKSPAQDPGCPIPFRRCAPARNRRSGLTEKHPAPRAPAHPQQNRRTAQDPLRLRRPDRFRAAVGERQALRQRQELVREFPFSVKKSKRGFDNLIFQCAGLKILCRDFMSPGGCQFR